MYSYFLHSIYSILLFVLQNGKITDTRWSRTSSVSSTGNAVLENKGITLRQIQSKIREKNEIFENMDRPSLSTLHRVLRMKQVYSPGICKWVLYSPTADAYCQHCINSTYFRIVIIMTVLHSMSLSAMVLCVSESPWARGGCSGAESASEGFCRLQSFHHLGGFWPT